MSPPYQFHNRPWHKWRHANLHFDTYYTKLDTHPGPTLPCSFVTSFMNVLHRACTWTLTLQLSRKYLPCLSSDDLALFRERNGIAFGLNLSKTGAFMWSIWQRGNTSPIWQRGICLLSREALASWRKAILHWNFKMNHAIWVWPFRNEWKPISFSKYRLFIW